MITIAKVGAFNPKLFATTATVLIIQKTVKEVIQYPKWFTAMKDEYNSLIMGLQEQAQC